MSEVFDRAVTAIQKEAAEITAIPHKQMSEQPMSAEDFKELEAMFLAACDSHHCGGDADKIWRELVDKIKRAATAPVPQEPKITADRAYELSIKAIQALIALPTYDKQERGALVLAMKRVEGLRAQLTPPRSKQ